MQKELSECTDQELLVKANKMKTTAFMNALLIGFLIGVIIFSIFKSTISLFTLVPLFFLYKILNGPDNDDKELKLLLKERGL